MQKKLWEIEANTAGDSVLFVDQTSDDRLDIQDCVRLGKALKVKTNQNEMLLGIIIFRAFWVRLAAPANPIPLLYILN